MKRQFYKKEEAAMANGSRRWYLTLASFSFPGGKMRTRHFLLRSDATEQALRKALRRIQCWFRKLPKEHRVFMAMFLPADPKPGETMVMLEELFRVRRRFADRRIYRIVNPAVCFVQGYGPEALEELNR